MNIHQFNEKSSTEIQDLLMRCVNIPHWAQYIACHRPYENRQKLLTTAKILALDWTWDDILTALHAHPKIGEKDKNSKHNYSSNEQADISQNASDLDLLKQANQNYEEKFGFIFLIKAKGLMTNQVLVQIKQRLNNTIDVEKKCVHEQLILITLLRLEQEIL